MQGTLMTYLAVTLNRLEMTMKYYWKRGNSKLNALNGQNKYQSMN